MKKHIKGPWVRSTHGFQVLTNDRMRTVAVLSDDLEENYDERVDTAALIAAAPELYEALVKLSKGNRSPGVLKIAREALSKIVWGF